MRLVQTAILGLIIIGLARASSSAQGSQPVVFQEKKLYNLERLASIYSVAAYDYAYIDRQRFGDTIFVRDDQETPAFRVGSLGKLIVAIGIMQLVEQNKLDLGDPVGRFLPDLPIANSSDWSNWLRLEHLLEHSSGLDEMHFKEYYLNESEPMDLKEALTRSTSCRRIRWNPGTCNSYSNLNYAIAARVIEVVSGEAADVWLRDHVLHKMGMDHSYFDRGLVKKYSIEVGRMDSEPVVEHDYLYYPAVGLVSTGHDMGLLLAFLLNEGQFAGDTVLQPASVQRLMRPETGPGAIRGWLDRDFGLGVRVSQGSGMVEVTATGYVSGFAAEMTVFPDRGAAWVVMTTDVSRRAEFWKEARGQFGREFNHGVYPHPPSGANPPVAGRYRHTSLRNALFAFEEDLYGELEVALETQGGLDQWIGRFPGQAPIRLVHDSAGVSGPGMDPHYLTYAAKTLEGKDFLLIEGQYYERTENPWPNRLRLVFEGFQRLVYAFTLILPLAFWFHRGRLKSIAGYGWVALTAILPYWAGWMAYGMLTSENFWSLGRLSAYSVGLGLLSLAIPALSLAGGWCWWRRWRGVEARSMAWVYLPLLLGNLVLTIYLAAYGMIPFFSWSY